MGIEPLSSAMTYQAQNAPKPAQPAAKSETEYMDGKTQNTPQQIDPTVVSIAKADQEGTNENQSGQNNQQPTNEQIKKAVENLNKKMSNSEALFGIHEDTNRVMIKIVDKKTKEVIKELPPEKTLDMIAKAWELAGLLVDERR
ncbi:MAG: flagellar protein FlaG [Clostridia bacterium]|nr:flagellar protein FlaG [Clostridia bacterium]